jgi:hypothetical protein
MTSCFDETLTAKDSTQESQRVRSDIALKMVVGEGAAPSRLANLAISGVYKTPLHGWCYPPSSEVVLWDQISRNRFYQLFALTGAHSASSDLISWYFSKLAGTKTKPSILANPPRSTILSPRLFSEMALICSRPMRFLNVHRPTRVRPSTKSWPMVMLPPLKDVKAHQAPITTGMIKVSITGWCFKCNRLSMIQRKPNMKQVIARNTTAFTAQDGLTSKREIS